MLFNPCSEVELPDQHVDLVPEEHGEAEQEGAERQTHGDEDHEAAQPVLRRRVGQVRRGDEPDEGDAALLRAQHAGQAGGQPQQALPGGDPN